MLLESVPFISSDLFIIFPFESFLFFLFHFLSVYYQSLMNIVLCDEKGSFRSYVLFGFSDLALMSCGRLGRGQLGFSLHLTYSISPFCVVFHICRQWACVSVAICSSTMWHLAVHFEDDLECGD